MRKLNGIAQFKLTIPAGAGLSSDEFFPLFAEARKNRLVVIESALVIENGISTMLSLYFCGEDFNRRQEFEALVLNTDWCSFAPKRRLLLHILKEHNLLASDAATILDTLLGKVMSHRNAFAHGKFAYADKKIWLEFYKGGPRRIEISDEWLTSVESDIHTVNQLCAQLHQLFVQKWKKSEAPLTVQQCHSEKGSDPLVVEIAVTQEL
jgi:hypothetical protein